MSFWFKSSFKKKLFCNEAKCGWLMCLLMVFCTVATADENEKPNPKRHIPSTPVALTLQTNHLQLTPKGSLRGLAAFELRPHWQAPILQAYGDLYRFGLLRFDFGVADQVTIQIRGALRQTLHLENSPVRVIDVGDFSVATLARVLPESQFCPALGFRIETKLPNTNQDRGIGNNTTDITMTVLATKQSGPALVFADVGIGILSAPRQLNDQNDVFVYGLGLMWKISQRLQFAGEINGFASARQQIPLGTEDRSAARLGVMLTLPKLALEVLAVKGLVEREGTLGVIAGLSWQIQLFSHHDDD